MINKKYFKTLTLFIASFAFFAFANTAKADKSIFEPAVLCTEGDTIDDQCWDGIAYIQGDGSVASYAHNHKIKCEKPGEVTIQCERTVPKWLIFSEKQYTYTKLTVLAKKQDEVKIPESTNEDDNKRLSDKSYTCVENTDITVECDGITGELYGGNGSVVTKNAETKFHCVKPGEAKYECHTKDDKYYDIKITVNKDNSTQDPGNGKKPTQETSRPDVSVSGLDDDTNSDVINAKNGSVIVKNTPTSIGGKTKIDGSVCQTYTICRTRNVSAEHGLTKGPYLLNQGNLMYQVTNACGKGANYTAFCLEAQFTGPSQANGLCLEYKATQIDPTSLYQVSLFELYKMSGGVISDDATYFKYEAAARYLAYMDGMGYKTRDNTSNENLDAHANPYRNGDTSILANGAEGALELAQQAKAAAESEIKNITDGTLGIRLNQIGGFTEQGGGKYQSAISVVIQNVASQDKAKEISFSDITFTYSSGDITVKQQGNPIYDSGAKTLTFTALVSGLNGKSGECSSASITAKLKYSTNSDIRAAFMLDAISDTDKANKQRFAVFAPYNGEVSYELPLNNCLPPSDDGCKPIAALYCNESDKNGIIDVNEGAESLGGATNWPKCIIGKHDSQGNSYDVVNNSGFKQTEETGDESDNIQGYTSDNKEIVDAAYCTVSCKEQYQFMLPGNKDNVKQGTYFSFHTDDNMSTHMVVGLNAERKCVSGNIKNEDYNKRALDLRAQMVDYLNAYVYYYQLYQALTSKKAAELYNAKIQAATIDSYTVDTCDSADPTSADQISKWKDNDKYIHGHYIDEFNFSDIDFTATLFYYENPNDVEDGELKTRTVSGIKGNQSFKDIITKNGFDFEIKRAHTVNTLGYNFYATRYADYNVFDEKKSGVDTWNDEPTAPYKYKDESEYDAGGYVTNDEGKREWKSDMKCTTDASWSPKTTTMNVVDTVDSSLWNTEETNMFYNDDSQFKNYLEVVKEIKEVMQQAKEKYKALTAQLAVQNIAIQECTNYLAYFDESTVPYTYDPVISFSYPHETLYNSILDHRLEPVTVHDLVYKRYFCEEDVGEGNEESIFGCSQDISSQIEFKYVLNIDLDLPEDKSEDIGTIASKLKASYNPNDANNPIKYYNVARVGSRAYYGDPENHELNWYQSPTVWYTNPQDGLATIKPNDNSTILDTDGRVYPVAITTEAGTYPFYVTFANIGQFNDSGTLGRIMGGGDGKSGTMSGETYDQQVCYYKVCRIDDPDCDGGEGRNYCDDKTNKRHYYDEECTDGRTPEQCKKDLCPEGDKNACITITESDTCNKGNISSSYTFPDAKFEGCIAALMDKVTAEDTTCCEYVKNYISLRADGNYANALPTIKGKDGEAINTKYERLCDKSKFCSSFKVITQTDYQESSYVTDETVISNNGALQMNARTISNYNVFPNNTSKETANWNDAQAKEVITQIESLGDGIFGDNKYRDYHIKLTSECLAAIRQYNEKEEGTLSGLSNGGFNDFTNQVYSSYRAQKEKEVSIEEIEDKKYGAKVPMSAEFKKILEENNCDYEGKDQPGRTETNLQDRSKVLS